ncbi:MAG TPA: DNA primase [Pirellulaceae bacterium]|nr:DNA primase [Pirellulaceae bacterium]
MSYSPAQDVKERVRQATDIVDLVGRYMELRRAGRNFVARCPWHDDRKPSLQINPERQSWKCWVCDIGGDVFSFVMKKEGVDFREALQMLADRAGIQVTQSREQIVPGGPDDKATLLKASAWAEKLFHECLLRSPEAAAARKYLAERRISPESVAQFRIGYSPDVWQWLIDRARSTPFTEAVLEACGLIGKSQAGRTYDRFKGRLIFPIRDLQDRPIAFGGRVLPGMSTENTGKYVNSPETRLFTKSDNLYALEKAREALVRDPATGLRSIVVVEGYTDVVIAHQCGMKNVVAVLGTALNERHLRLLRRFVDVTYLVLDGDDAGQRRTNEVLGLFVANNMDMRILTLPDGLDPADFLLERGGDEFRQLLGGAVDALEHKLRVATQGIDLTRDTHLANRALEDILATLAGAPKPTILDGSVGLRQQQVVARLARQFHLDEVDLRARLNELRKAHEKSQERSEGWRLQGPERPATGAGAYVRKPAPTGASSSPAGRGGPGGNAAGGGPPPGAVGDGDLSSFGEPDYSLEGLGGDALDFDPGQFGAAQPSGRNAGGHESTQHGAPGDDAGSFDGGSLDAGSYDAGSAESAADRPSIRPKSLPVKEVELLEILIAHPELAVEAFGQLTVDDFLASVTKTLFASLRALHEMGEPIDFQHVLTTLEDERLKNLLVTLDEASRAKELHATIPAAVRLDDLFKHYRQKREDRAIAKPGSGKRGFEEDLELLKQNFELERQRRGLMAPMEG